MRHFSFFVILSLHVAYSINTKNSNFKPNSALQQDGSHNLLKLGFFNNSINRPVRCTPCGSDRVDKKPISNQIGPEYRGNGADNLGYDWSPMAWGGLAFPQKSKMFMGNMRGREGRQMPDNWNGNQGSVHIICDTCRSYWNGAGESNIKMSGSDRGSLGRGRQYGSGSQEFGNDQSGYYPNNKAMAPQDYEARVSSPTVGVLVKPGSRIAYIPSRSGEMYWDGVSGGGTRWDGFSNGISWIGNGSPEWDRSDTFPREDKTEYNPGSGRPENNRPYSSDSFSGYDGLNRNSGWPDNGKQYYFSNGQNNQIDPQRRDQGYASGWHYGSTNQNGWNGSNMKYNLGGKQWEDNDRAANRFYFNTPQDRTYGPSGDRNNFQYGNQYPNYQPPNGYSNYRPQQMWRPDGGYRVNDRDPSGFQTRPNSNKDRPWDYTAGDSFNNRRPGQRPEWSRPGPGYTSSDDYDKDNPGKYQNLYNTSPNKFPGSDKNSYEKPWNGPVGYGPIRQSAGGGFPYGGNRYPGDTSGGRPSSPPSGNHLFYPNDRNQQPNYPNVNSVSGGNIRPTYPSGSDRPGSYPNVGNPVGTYPSPNDKPISGYPDSGKPTLIYTGGMQLGGTSGGYPNRGTSPGGYATTESSLGGSSGGYPGGGNSPNIYQRPSVEYSGGGNLPGGYPGRPGFPGGYTSGGGGSGDYSGSGNSGSYPGAIGNSGGYFGEGSKPTDFGRPPSGYQSGGRPDYGYPAEQSGRPGGYRPGGGRPDNYPEGEYPSGGYRPSGGGSFYPGPDGRPGTSDSSGSSGYPGGYRGSGRYPPGGNRVDLYPGRPDEYSDGGAKPPYPVRGRPGYFGTSDSGGRFPQSSKKPPKGYYTGYITEIGTEDGPHGGKYPNYYEGRYPGDKNSYPGKDKNRYPFNGGESNRYPNDGKDRYPANADERYSGGGSSGSYPLGNKDRYPALDRDGDRYYYGQGDMKGKYPNGFPSNHRYPTGGNNGDFNEPNSSSNSNKNTWNYGQDERKDGIYRRSGGSYPAYRGGQYYTSSYLASMSTTSGTQEGSETKTQSMTKTEEVTQPTSGS